MISNPEYWVITREAIYRHTEPGPDDYRNRTTLRPGDHIPVPYADTELAIADLLVSD